TTCRSCKKSYQVGGGGREIELRPAVVERARCDAQNLGDLEAETPTRIAQSVTPRMREHVLARDGYMCRVPGCRSQRNLELHHLVFRRNGGQHHASNLL